MLALDDLKIIELPCFDAMPYFAAAMAGKTLAEFGAEIIKVEPPGVGAQERHRGPFPGQQPNRETRALHLFLNANKLGVTLDLAQARGRELLLKLLAQADVLFNPNPGAVNQRLGLEWQPLIERFPRLVVVSMGFFGSDSPYRDLRGGDLIANHMSGVSYETPYNQVTDPANEPPLKLGGRQSDYLTGYTAAASAMAAVAARKKTGAGQHVDICQWMAMVSMIRHNIGMLSHDAPQAPAYQRIMSRTKVNLQWVYPCRDGWVAMRPTTDKFWAGTMRMMGEPDWAQGELFATEQARLENADGVEAGMMSWLAEHDKQEIFLKGFAQRVPCFPVYNPREVAHNEQYRARGFFVECDHPLAGRLTMPGPPYRLGRTPATVRSAAPALGEHNRIVYCERLGLDDEQFNALLREEVI
ncbi:MAG TPA: CoA transferase [Candidatus Binataceae bacterium]|jgi:crotonobetainyl-CoA:carnitine CoA-transferase CaiB-like acyl-CoA transferase|nr:CoA transferase [Candidatus Binataceae bacterium]